MSDCVEKVKRIKIELELDISESVDNYLFKYKFEHLNNENSGIVEGLVSELLGEGEMGISLNNVKILEYKDKLYDYEKAEYIE